MKLSELLQLGYSDMSSGESTLDCPYTIANYSQTVQGSRMTQQHTGCDIHISSCNCNIQDVIEPCRVHVLHVAMLQTSYSYMNAGC
jgi:hypothetical protein